MLEREVRANLVYRAFTRIGGKRARYQAIGATGTSYWAGSDWEAAWTIDRGARERSMVQGRKKRDARFGRNRIRKRSIVHL